jgi:hypothetical protein
MDTLKEIRYKLFEEIVSDDSDVRGKFLEKFKPQAEEFSDWMAKAVIAWRDLDAKVGGDKKLAYLSALVFTALTLHIQSMKLFLSGQLIAAGNAFRQVVESIALALVCSGKGLNALERFIEEKYSTNDAIRDVLRNSRKLGLIDDSVKGLREAQGFYHRYSHPTKMTIASVTSFSEKGVYVGASYDEGKIETYTKEVNGRVGLAKVLVSFVEAVKANVGKW